jgi:hypothetical protein
MIPLSPTPNLRNPAKVLLALAVSLAGFTSSQFAQTTQRTVESQAAPVRDHRLFVGVDIKILYNQEFQTVLDYSGHQAQLEDDPDDRIDVRTVNQARFETVTKIGRNPLSISDVKTSRDYSIVDDSGQRWAEQRAAMESFQGEEQGRLVGDLKDPHSVATGGTRGNRNSTFYRPTSNLEERVSAALDAEIQTQLDDQFYANEGQQESHEKTALVVQATVSSPAPLVGAYAVAIARVIMKGTLHDLILFSDLAPLGSSPGKIEIRKENLPLDLQVIKVDLHLFREGQEMVSDQSPNQFPLTRDEALQYLTLAHITDYKGKTLPAQPAWSLPPPVLLAAESPDQFDFPIRVSIDAQGRVTAIDESAILPPAIRELVQQTVFVPALDAGAAIASDITLNLRDFFR